jgi:DNA processing protein
MTPIEEPTNQTIDPGPFAAAIASLGIGRATIRRILTDCDPQQAWEAIVNRKHPADPDGSLAEKADPSWPELFDKRLSACGARVLIRGGSGYPEALEGDVDSPQLLFSLGHPDAISGRARVAVVGTRAATRYGAEVASEIASGLASANVVVVSGLAAGIDAAAHMGAVHSKDGAPPVAVIATGIDIAYPRSNEVLRDAVAERGAVVSELPPGGLSERWRFADRNRLMAALSHVVVVVECHHSGGALYTVRAAKQRGVEVMAVPGSVRSPASAGTNALLADGMPPARDVKDVLTAVELAIAGDRTVAAPRWPKDELGSSGNSGPRPRPTSEISARVFAVLDYEPASLEQVVIRSGSTIGEAAAALRQLADQTLVDEDRGFWWRRGRRKSA